MSLVSVEFLIFVAITVALYYIVPVRMRWVLLLVASYAFYLFGGIKPVIFIISTTLTTYFAGRFMAARPDKKDRKPVLLGLIVLNFGILLALKYYNFVGDQINGLFSLFSWDASVPLLNIVLPLGISFYTFQAMAYAIDCYRGKVEPSDNIAHFALYISFFPQVIQGPIARYNDLNDQLFNEKPFDYETFRSALLLMMWGFFKKMVIADRLAIPVEKIFDGAPADGSHYSSIILAVGIVGYALQIYTDFSGGIDIIRATAGLMGIQMAQNFERPYFGDSLAEYWRRWHMSLTQWMRDYVFFPITFSKLCKNLGKWARKKGKKKIYKQAPAYPPTFVVFFLIGIWHGAGWGFIVYGLWNSCIIVGGMMLADVFEGMIKGLHIDEKTKWFKVFRILRTFTICCLGKTLSRASSVGLAFSMMGGLVANGSAGTAAQWAELGLDTGNWIVLALSLLVLFTASLLQERGHVIGEDLARLPLPARWAFYLLTIAVILVLGIYGPGYDAGEFIYRQF